MIKSPLLLLAAASMMLSTVANASVESQLAKCAGVQDKLERLVCYDNLATAINNNNSSVAPTSETVSVASSTAVVNSAQPQKSKVEEFGNLRKQDDEETINVLHLTVNKVSKDPYGALKIQFNNGQVWKQTDSRNFKLKPEQAVYIEKAALGSFILGTEGRNTTIRVKRLK